MLQTILFDLDGTLLPMEEKQFLSTYYRALYAEIGTAYEKAMFFDALNAGVYAMLKGDEGKSTNDTRFWQLFCAMLGAEEAVLRLKERYPQIRLVLVLPCPPEQQTLKWNAEQKRRYYDIMARADKVRVLSERYSSSCMLDRNRHMVDSSGYLICYLRELSGGTYYTVNYAERVGVEIVRI
ncbi:MAG: DUF1273 family protein [Oscillospiraceae bacterium]|nr:DUF1273 family protein [Oscillospiraceae bacterium]